MADILTCRVHPTVFLNIVDFYERRNEDAKRVIGTLLGSYDVNGHVEVTDCFTVPHTEVGDEVAVHIEFAKTSTELHKIVNQSEVIVGWFSTGSDVTAHSVLIHEYYTRDCKNSIHLTVDTTLKGGKMSMKAYVSIPLGVPDKSSGTMFRPIEVTGVMSDAEKVGVDFLQRSKHAPDSIISLDSDYKQISDTCLQLQERLAIISQYIQQVISGEIPSDAQLGRVLMDLMNSVPQIQPKQFQDMIDTNKKDLLMVLYLTDLVKSQIILNEKISLL